MRLRVLDLLSRWQHPYIVLVCAVQQQINQLSSMNSQTIVATVSGTSQKHVSRHLRARCACSSTSCTCKWLSVDKGANKFPVSRVCWRAHTHACASCQGMMPILACLKLYRLPVCPLISRGFNLAGHCLKSGNIRSRQCSPETLCFALLCSLKCHDSVCTDLEYYGELVYRPWHARAAAAARSFWSAGVSSQWYRPCQACSRPHFPQTTCMR